LALAQTQTQTNKEKKALIDGQETVGCGVVWCVVLDWLREECERLLLFYLPPERHVIIRGTLPIPASVYVCVCPAPLTLSSYLSLSSQLYIWPLRWTSGRLVLRPRRTRRVGNTTIQQICISSSWDRAAKYRHQLRACRRRRV